MSVISRNAFKYASESIVTIPGVEGMSDEAVIHNIKFMAYAAGSQRLLELAKELSLYGAYSDGEPYDNVVDIVDLEALFEEETK